jgi:hypothetical protein
MLGALQLIRALTLHVVSCVPGSENDGEFFGSAFPECYRNSMFNSDKIERFRRTSEKAPSIENNARVIYAYTERKNVQYVITVPYMTRNEPVERVRFVHRSVERYSADQSAAFTSGFEFDN